jgi:hypothetical protein
VNESVALLKVPVTRQQPVVVENVNPVAWNPMPWDAAVS